MACVCVYGWCVNGVYVSMVCVFVFMVGVSMVRVSQWLAHVYGPTFNVRDEHHAIRT